MLQIENIPNDTNAEFLQALLSTYGNITKIILKKECGMQLTAYVNFIDYKSAENALSNLADIQIDGRTVKFTLYDVEADQTLLVKNLDEQIQSQDLFETFNRFYDVISCDIPLVEGKSCGFAIVKFKRAYDVKRAMNLLNGSVINERAITIEPYSKDFEFNVSLNTEEREVNSFLKSFPLDIKNGNESNKIIDFNYDQTSDPTKYLTIDKKITLSKFPQPSKAHEKLLIELLYFCEMNGYVFEEFAGNISNLTPLQVIYLRGNEAGMDTWISSLQH